MSASSTRRWPVVLAVAACCVATLLVKLHVNRFREYPGHGDVSFYYTVAKNLVEGRGFQIDYLWGFWGEPTGLPTPSNLWWMPLTSLVAAAGMWLGQGDYASAQLGTSVCSSLAPWIVYLLGRDLFSRRTGLLGALLATTLHLFLGQPSAPISASPYVVLVPLGLWLALHVAARPAWLFWAGVVVALAQLTRTDGLLLVAPLAVGLLWGRAPRPPTTVLLRGAALALLGYGLTMAPWWARNLSVFGVLQPAVSGRALFMTGYDQWHALPASVTPQTWLADGWGPVLALKAQVAWANLLTFFSGLTVGAPQEGLAWKAPALAATLVLSWVGLLGTLQRRFLPLWTHVVGVWAFYSLAFTVVGHGSFRSAMYGFYGFLLLCAVRGVERGAAWLARRLGTPRSEPWLVGVLIALLLIGQYRFAAESLGRKAEAIARLAAYHRALEEQVFAPLGMDDAVVMTRDVHEFHALLGRRCVQIPAEDADTILAVARRYGVTHILLGGGELLRRRPGLADLLRRPEVRTVFGPARLGPRTVRLLALED